MNIAIACDHAGFDLKERLKDYLIQRGHTLRDFGCDSTASCDYPLYGRAAARAVAAGECERGIVVCSTGIGISIAANKVHGIRCALCAEPFSAEMTRRHNNANMLAIGASVTGPVLAERIAEVFLNTDFEGGRHARRVAMIEE